MKTFKTLGNITNTNDSVRSWDADLAAISAKDPKYIILKFHSNIRFPGQDVRLALMLDGRPIWIPNSSDRFPILMVTRYRDGLLRDLASSELNKFLTQVGTLQISIIYTDFSHKVQPTEFTVLGFDSSDKMIPNTVFTSEKRKVSVSNLATSICPSILSAICGVQNSAMKSVPIVFKKIMEECISGTSHSIVTIYADSQWSSPSPYGVIVISDKKENQCVVKEVGNISWKGSYLWYNPWWTPFLTSDFINFNKINH